MVNSPREISFLRREKARHVVLSRADTTVSVLHLLHKILMAYL